MTMKFELVSFALCPYVQRSVITLKYKNVPFGFREIDLHDPPAWFDEISPLGKVPVLLVDGKTAIFESAVINEFIDDVTEPHLQARDPLQKALERAWIEFGSELLGCLYGMTTETDASRFEESLAEFADLLSRTQAVLGDGGYFRGNELSLVDTAYAPLFMRLRLLPRIHEDRRVQSLGKVGRWADALLDLPAVRESVVADFAERYVGSLQKLGSLAV